MARRGWLVEAQQRSQIFYAAQRTRMWAQSATWRGARGHCSVKRAPAQSTLNDRDSVAGSSGPRPCLTRSDGCTKLEPSVRLRALRNLATLTPEFGAHFCRDGAARTLPSGVPG